MAQRANGTDRNTPRAGRLPEGVLVGGLTLLLLVVIGIFVYRMSTRPAQPDVAAVDPSPVDKGGERLPGGFDPQPKFGNTRDEVEHRGAGQPPQGPMPGLGSLDPVTRLSDITRDRRPVPGQRVELKDVEVDSADAHSFRIREGNDTMEVVAPAGTPPLRRGERVSVSGRVETAGGEARINATRVERKD